MTRRWFVTGTDTEIGKTTVSCALLHAARARGLTAIGMKPVASGINTGGSNDDVDALIAASSGRPARDLVNPYLFREAVAPHLAAAHESRRIDLDTIDSAYHQLQALADVLIVEGVGGFCVPLDTDLDTAEMACRLALPVILVVGLRLGCINHALLTEEAIRRRQLILAGWVANCIDPAMRYAKENIATLEARIDAPLLGVLPFQPQASGEDRASRLRLPD